MRQQAGFTLLELLISITLVAVLVVILSMALRSSINAYTRAKEYNRYFMPAASVHGLLWRQMETVITRSTFQLSAYSRFRGRENGLTFTSTCVPQGTSEGGIFQVAYLFDDMSKQLIYAQKIITTRHDLEPDILDRLVKMDQDELMQNGWLSETMKDVEAFSMAYRSSGAEDETNPDKWDNEYRNTSHLPLEIAFKIRFKGQKEEGIKWQVIPVGIK